LMASFRRANQEHIEEGWLTRGNEIRFDRMR